MAKKFIQAAIKRPGALRREMGAKTEKGPQGGTVKKKIPMSKLNALITRLQKAGEGDKKLPPNRRRLLKQALLARTLRGFKKR